LGIQALDRFTTDCGWTEIDAPEKQQPAAQSGGGTL
jgi:hypothetical protein